MPSPPPSGNMETPVVAPSLLDALLPWGVKAAEMVDAVFRPVAEQATQVVDVRLSEALVPSRLAAAPTLGSSHPGRTKMFAFENRESPTAHLHNAHKKKVLNQNTTHHRGSPTRHDTT